MSYITLKNDVETISGEILKAGCSFQVAEWFNFGGGCYIFHSNPKFINPNLVPINNEDINKEILKIENDKASEAFLLVLKKYYKD